MGFTSKIILGADDIGVVKSIDDAVIDLVNIGALNSAELLPNYGDQGSKSVENGLRIIEETKASQKPFEMGIHLTVTSGYPVTNALANDNFLEETKEGKYAFPSYRRLKSTASSSGLYTEMKKQVSILRSNEVLNSKITHISNHHDALWFYPQYAEVLIKISNEENLPIRNTRTLPWIKGKTYYVTQNLLRKIQSEDKKCIKEFFYARDEMRFPGKAQTFYAPNYMDNSHYGAEYLMKQSKENEKRIKNAIAKNHESMVQMFARSQDQAYEKQKDITAEFMFHVRKGNLLKKGYIHEVVDYPGINTKYFDGRTIEYRSLVHNNELIQAYLNQSRFETGSWKNVSQVSFRKGLDLPDC